METRGSNGRNNDALVDNLMKCRHIRTKTVERVFRAVDIADYILPIHSKSTYRKFTWKHGKIRVLAPWIYCEVLENLCLKPGQSFLHLGSGTGYLSTMAGLILKQHGTNHGIELHEDCLKYAYERLEEFKQKSLALDEFEFCEPLFIQGYVKQFVRVGGILLIHYRGFLTRMLRTDTVSWLHYQLFAVSCPKLVVPTASEQTSLYFPERNPLSLRELCRCNIRNRLRENVWNEHEDLESRKPVALRQRLAFARLITEESVVSEDEARVWASVLCDQDENQDWQDTFEYLLSDPYGQDPINVESENALLEAYLSNVRDRDNDDDTFFRRKKDVNLNNEDGSSNSHTNNSDSPSVIFGHYVNSIALSTYMTEKIHRLPLPVSLKLYINYNRKL